MIQLLHGSGFSDILKAAVIIAWAAYAAGI
jgi:hypothetical protein